MNESQTRLDKIDPKLKAAGWNTTAESRILTEHLIAPGRISRTKKAKIKKADYVLTYKGMKLAVVEAKSDELHVEEGVQQAKEYAEMLCIRYTYACNGDKIYAIDMQTGEEGEIDCFPSPEVLWRRTFGYAQELRDKLNAIEPYSSDGKTLRYYQEIAVNRTMQAIADEQKRILLTLATGTGKTFIASQIAWKLFQARWNISGTNRQPRILFLADRNILAGQAFNGFGAFPEDALIRIDPKSINKAGKVPTNGHLFFTIFQTFMTGDTPHFGQYPNDFFDLIVIDECHRGGANEEGNWRGILEYFSPAVQLGLTATPRRDTNVDTYDYFGEPVYTYSLKQGIDDGFLTPFRHCKMQSNIDDYIYSPDDIVVSGVVQEGYTYKEDDFYKGDIKLRDRDMGRVKEFMSYVASNEKTLVFCASQPHAAEIRDMINQVKKVKHPNYCVRVTANDGALGEVFLKAFQDNDLNIPMILTTSEKLSTGVDALNVRNIVLMRPVNSMIEFKQIIGRGTRLYDGKYYFTIYDFVKAYEKFYDPQWDGEPTCPKCGNTPCTCEGGGTDTPKPKPVCVKCGKRPCVCEKEVKICALCGKTPCVCPPEVKLEIKLSDGRRRAIKHIKSDMFWGSDGKPVTAEEFIESMYGRLPEFFSSEQELRQLWSDPNTRKALLAKMDEAGYGEDVLREVQKLINAEGCDLFDVLEYVAYAAQPIERGERAATVRHRYFHSLSYKQQDFIDFVLKNYEETGDSELALDKLPTLLKMKFGTVNDGITALGDLNIARDTFTGFQKHLYGVE